MLISLAARTYRGGPPIPDRVVSATGMALFTVTVWRHGVYLGPDFSASYLHAVVDERALLKHNGYDDRTRTLALSDVEATKTRRGNHTLIYAGDGRGLAPAKRTEPPGAVRC